MSVVILLTGFVKNTSALHYNQNAETYAITIKIQLIGSNDPLTNHSPESHFFCYNLMENGGSKNQKTLILLAFVRF